MYSKFLSMQASGANEREIMDTLNCSKATMDSMKRAIMRNIPEITLPKK